MAPVQTKYPQLSQVLPARWRTSAHGNTAFGPAAFALGCGASKNEIPDLDVIIIQKL